MKSFNRIIALFLFVLLLVGCDSDSGNEPDVLDGTWAFSEQEDGTTAYLVIAFPRLDIYADESGSGCYNRTRFTGERVSGDRFEITMVNGETEISTFRVEDDVLIIDEGRGDEVRLNRSSVNVVDLPLCGNRF